MHTVTRGGYGLAALVVAAVTAVHAQDGASLNTQRVLRQRVGVVPVPTVSDLSNLVTVVSVDMKAVGGFAASFGTVAGDTLWGEGQGELLAALGRGKSARPELLSAADGARLADCSYALLTRFEEKGSRRRILAAVVDLPGHTVERVLEGRGASFAAAAATVAGELDRVLSLVRWTASVVKLDGENAVINRGHFDGVREGQTFRASSVGATPEGTAESVELAMLTAKAEAMCEVVKVSENYAVVRAKDAGYDWRVGDLVSLAPVLLEDRDPKSRGRAVWDKVHERK